VTEQSGKASVKKNLPPGSELDDMAKHLIAPMILAVLMTGLAAGAPAVLDSAVTRDTDANGYLDRIELYFDSAVTFPPDFSLSNIAAAAETVSFHIDSISGIQPSGKTATRFDIFLQEDSTAQPGVLQTGWRPVVSVSGLSGVGDFQGFMCKDGAGPVIKSVIKHIPNAEDRTQDRVVVIFSEPVMKNDGSLISPSDTPGRMFTVWKRLLPDTVIGLYPELLDSINAFSANYGDTMLEFCMTNGKDLTTNYFFSLSNNGGVLDKASNPPGGNNRRVVTFVLVNLHGDNFGTPNLSRPTCSRVAPGVFYLKHEPMARSWVRQDGAGMVISFNNTDRKASIRLKISDSFGTIVASGESDSGAYLGALDTVSESVVIVDIYWNGTDPQGNYVHEGTYVAEIKYFAPGQEDPVVSQQTFYIEKLETGHSLCGGGYSVALLPLIGLRLRRVLRIGLLRLLRRRR
jgi:hypothetical protein